MKSYSDNITDNDKLHEITQVQNALILTQFDSVFGKMNKLYLLFTAQIIANLAAIGGLAYIIFSK